MSVIDISNGGMNKYNLADLLSLELIKIKSKQTKTILYVNNSSSIFVQNHSKIISGMHGMERQISLKNYSEIKDLNQNNKVTEQDSFFCKK